MTPAKLLVLALVLAASPAQPPMEDSECDKPEIISVLTPVQPVRDMCTGRDIVALTTSGFPLEAIYRVQCPVRPKGEQPIRRPDSSLETQRGNARPAPGARSWSVWIAAVPLEVKVDWDAQEQRCRQIFDGGPVPEEWLPGTTMCRRGSGTKLGLWKGAVAGPLPVLLAIDLSKLTPEDGTYAIKKQVSEPVPDAPKFQHMAREAEYWGNARRVVACTPKTDHERKYIHTGQASRALSVPGHAAEALREIDMAWHVASVESQPYLAQMKAMAHKQLGNRYEECRWYEWAASRLKPENNVFLWQVKPDCVAVPTDGGDGKPR